MESKVIYCSDKVAIVPLIQYNEYIKLYEVRKMYITVKEAAAKWSISDRRVRVLCEEGKITGAFRKGRSWQIPCDAKKPEDGGEWAL